MEKLKYFAGGQYRESKTDKYNEVYNPSTGEVTALVPCCTKEEVEETIAIAKEAYKTWSKVPIVKRVQILYKVRQLIEEHMEELTMLVAQEHGKVWSEAEGDVLKAKEGTELACSAPSLIMGESLMNASKGFDTVYAAMDGLNEEQREKLLAYTKELERAEKIINGIQSRTMRTFVLLLYVDGLPPEKVREELNMSEWGFRRARDCIEKAPDMESVDWQERYVLG